MSGTLDVLFAVLVAGALTAALYRLLRALGALGGPEDEVER